LTLIIILIVGAYLVGSIPVGVLIGRMKGFDPRAVGSGNIGMTNVGRAGGKEAAALTFSGDLLKGAIPVLAARTLSADPRIIAIVGFAAFIGSIASIFLGFQGGRGVSASLGVWLALAPATIGIALGVFVVIFAITRTVSMASICASIALPPAAAAMGLPRPYILLAIVMAALVVLRHRENISRLIRGEEQSYKAAQRRGN
ncbi:MAG: glycerol-3-phosphate 1-O-acyltransferase PlsY, partial [Candidatus Binataceae bacterium]